MDRRRFLLRSGAAWLGAAGLRAAEPAASKATETKTEPVKKKDLYVPPHLVEPLVGSQLYGWGQYYDLNGKKLAEHLDEVFRALHDIGYDYAEATLDVANPENNLRLAERMTKAGLKPVSFYTGGAAHVLGKATETAERIAVAARVAAKAGFGIVNFNPDPIGRDKTDRELEIQADAIRELGEDLAAGGIRLGIHHHTPELRNEGREFHSNFSRCPGTQVGFCYDVHWVYRGGIAPMDCLRRYGSRVVSWHLRQSRERIWWEDLDAGDLDYRAIAAYAVEHRLPRFYTVELALEAGTRVTRDSIANHQRSREYVRSVFGV